MNLRKLEQHREGGSPKHLTDIQAILRSGVVDRVLLLEKIAEQGLEGSGDASSLGEGSGRRRWRPSISSADESERHLNTHAVRGTPNF